MKVKVVWGIRVDSIGFMCHMSTLGSPSAQCIGSVALALTLPADGLDSELDDDVDELDDELDALPGASTCLTSRRRSARSAAALPLLDPPPLTPS